MPLCSLVRRWEVRARDPNSPGAKAADNSRKLRATDLELHGCQFGEWINLRRWSGVVQRSLLGGEFKPGGGRMRSRGRKGRGRCVQR
eukprot:2820270-Pyramimonas_sp.AAC.1